MFFEDIKGKKRTERSMFVPMDYVKKDFEKFKDYELHNCIGKDFVFDVESYINLFFVGFKCCETGKIVRVNHGETDKLNWLIWNLCLISFNGIHYDIPIITLALAGYSESTIKYASDLIIKQGARDRDIEQEFKVKIPTKLNHIDLKEVAPLDGSLKLYAGRMHAPRLQELPYPDTHTLSPSEADVVRLYCLNDLENTDLLYKFLKPQIELRKGISEKYDEDCRSKSDAQISEVVFTNEVKKVTGKYPRRPTFKAGHSFNYKPPEFINYFSPQLQAVFSKVQAAKFVLNENGYVECPEMEKLPITAGNNRYTMGLGGLHSTEESVTHIANEDVGLFDNDVASYYPRCILNSGIYPKAIGEPFKEVYGGILDRRLHAKGKSKECKKENRIAEYEFWMTEDTTLKITNNGTFGKTGSPYSILYEPELMIYTTITGQLSILMLIEWLVSERFNVISANTDGIIIKCERIRKPLLDKILAYWQNVTNFATEETEYQSVYSRDVNNYIAIKPDGEIKLKGSVFAEKGSTGNTILSKNPKNLICVDALTGFLKDKKPIEQTIFECKDLRRFVTVQQVRFGAEKDGFYLGKVIRWYYATDATGFISIVGSGNKVPDSDFAKPCMDMPTEFPADINYQWYIDRCDRMLYEIGYKQLPKQEILI